MRRWGTVIGAVALLSAAPAAHAGSAARVVLASCVRAVDVDGGLAVFEGRMEAIKGATRMQMRFTLQARTPERPAWRTVKADGFGVWTSAEPGKLRYVYDKTVERLLAPGSYRASVSFRWRNARGRVVRFERAVSAACRQPDPRPNLVVRSVSVEPTLSGDRRYVAVVSNSGRGAAGVFTVDFTRNGTLLGSAIVEGLAPRAVTRVAVTAPACVAGDQIAAQADAQAAIDESDEDDDALAVSCP